MYVGTDGREYEDAEMDNMRRDAADARMHEMRKRPLTRSQVGLLVIADHLSRSYTPLRANTVRHFNTIAALLRRGYLERYQGEEFMFRITLDGREVLEREGRAHGFH